MCGRRTRSSAQRVATTGLCWKSAGDLIVFLDGDCIAREDFIEQHLRRSQPGWFVRGNRMKLSEQLTKSLLSDQSLSPLKNTFGLMRLWQQGSVGRFFPLLRLPLGNLRYIKKEEWRPEHPLTATRQFRRRCDSTADCALPAERLLQVVDKILYRFDTHR